MGILTKYFVDFGDLDAGKKIITENFANWTSGNEIIDTFIQKKQLNYDGRGVVFEWIPYSELIDIKEIEDNCLTTAILKGSLCYDRDEKEWIKRSYEKVILRFLYVLHDSITDEIETYLNHKSYGISQNPDTKNYILIFDHNYRDNYCEKCELEKYTIAIWEKGPLYHNINDKKLIRKSCEKVCLKYQHSLQDITNEFLNKVESYLTNKLVFGISQNPETKILILVFSDKYFEKFCEICDNRYESEWNKWCGFDIAIWKDGPLNYIGEKGMMKESYKKVGLKYLYNSQEIANEFLVEIESHLIDKRSYGLSQNPDTKVYILVIDAIWKDGPLNYSKIKSKYKRDLSKDILLKYLTNSQNVDHIILNKIVYSIKKSYGLTQDPFTKDFILVLQLKYYCEFCGEMYNNQFEVDNKSCTLCQINCEYQEINDLIQKMRLRIDYNSSKSMVFEWIRYDQFDCIREVGKGGFATMVHRDFHPGNILFINDNACISDMGLCKNIDDINETSVYGVLPYVAPEVLKRKPYTQAADIYSFGMIMYIIATGRLPFADCAHDIILALCICKGIRPKINEFEAPKCYIDLMEKCWDSNPDNRPNAIEIIELINFFSYSLRQKFRKKEQKCHEIEEQFKITQQTRITNLLSIKNNTSNTHKQAIYKSRLLNPFTGNLSDNDTVEIPDLIK
ncbi:kinase-like domain-containing protein [Rhizophagus clarus]|uniref:Kinase-like domain-containing protein n=1 Tax=Rhizophagus clarus TaxID=94130 RepID=A0A8H3M278_9GLOM|nr:kinase-like domain-containing protein [Rhizophagus clarus]